MTADNTTQTIKLKDGRALAYAEWGETDGVPVFHFHGSSSSRLEHPPDESMLSGVRLITVDRPGHGMSDFQPNRQPLDWPDDVTALVDHLGIDKFAVTGQSFGGFNALACAYKIPERLTAVAVISNFAPYDRPGALDGVAAFNRIALRMARWMPFWLGRRFMMIQGRMIRDDPERAAAQILSTIPESDQQVLTDPQVKQVLLTAMSEAYANGADGPAQEAAMFVRNWGFRLQDITIPVHIWHGEADANNSLQFGKHLDETIPNTHSTFLPGEGHFFIMKRWGEILAQLIENS